MSNHNQAGLKPDRGMNVLIATAATVETLAANLRAIDAPGAQAGQRVRETLQVTRALEEATNELRERAIAAALRERRMTLREIGSLVGLSAPQVMQRARKLGIDTSRTPGIVPTWARRQAG